MLFLLITLGYPVYAVNEIRTVGNSGANYSTLKNAFDAINAGTLTGNVTLRIVSGTTETATATLNASGTGSASYTSLNIYPSTSGVTISGNINAPLIDLNGADNVTIDGRLNGAGFFKALTIVNSSNSSAAGISTIRFVNDASANTVKYCTLKGAQTNPTTGVVFF